MHVLGHLWFVTLFAFVVGNPIIVILAFDRTSHLRQTIRSINQVTPDTLAHIPVFVSIDENPKAKR